MLNLEACLKATLKGFKHKTAFKEILNAKMKILSLSAYLLVS